MKHFFILLCVFAFTNFGYSQNTQANNNTRTVTTYATGTLTNASTVTNTVADSLNYPYNYEVHIYSDSLTGSTAATAYIETKPFNQVGTMWCPVTSVTINGGLTYAPVTGSALSGMLRVRTVGTGTQSTTISSVIQRIRKTQ